MESLELAFDQGADAVEFDVVFTKDGHPVIRHDLDLVSTTDISNHSFLSTKVDELTLEDLQRLAEGRDLTFAKPKLDLAGLVVEVDQGDAQPTLRAKPKKENNGLPGALIASAVLNVLLLIGLVAVVAFG